MLWHAITWYDMRYVGYDNHKNSILSQLAFLEKVSHYSLIRIFSIFYDHFLARLMNASHSFKLAIDWIWKRFWCIYFRTQGPRAQWVVGYRVSNVVWFANFRLLRLKHFAEENHKEKNISYWISDSEACQSLIDLRYEILLFISYNYNVHRSYLLILSCGFWSVVAAKIWICAREIYIEFFLFHISAVKY
jgi:hypothetical protein